MAGIVNLIENHKYAEVLQMLNQADKETRDVKQLLEITFKIIQPPIQKQLGVDKDSLFDILAEISDQIEDSYCDRIIEFDKLVSAQWDNKQEDFVGDYERSE